MPFINYLLISQLSNECSLIVPTTVYIIYCILRIFLPSPSSFFMYLYFFSHMWSMMRQTRMDSLFPQNLTSSIQNQYLARSTKFTLVVPSNAAWEKAQMNFNKAYNTLIEGQFPQYVSFLSLLNNILPYGETKLNGFYFT